MGKAGSAWGKSQGLSKDGREHSQECYMGMWTCWTALPHGSAVQHSRGKLIPGDRSVFLWFWRLFHLIHLVSKTLLSPACSCPMLLPVLGTFDSCSISLFCQWATGSVLELDELEGNK